ncbi:zinc finger CCCH domain-containing protein 10-like [Oppia nitens]|uniref:zinc finger CCCH domain-containing protein 10-like n=1 Tax=Oppia nitens TaxID=1686743 RepID=UPI0023DA35A1|nr:zinc finger CCCH domain-containing protein 10-like [Oppia nitens]
MYNYMNASIVCKFMNRSTNNVLSVMSDLPLINNEDNGLLGLGDHHLNHVSINNNNNINDNHSHGGLHDDGIGDVCRDFLRNVCRRGNACRFRHPDPSEAEELGKKIEYIFCHDYQNRECRRQNCRFLHCTKQEEEVYRSTGKLPQHVLDKMAQNKASEMMQQSNVMSTSMMVTNVPVCKDYLKGECRRGPGRCKFRHVSQSEYDMEMQARGGANNHSSSGGGGSSGGGHHGSSRYDGPHPASRNPMHNSFNASFNDNFSPPEPKRRAYDTSAAYNTNSFAPYGDRGGQGGGNVAGLGGLQGMNNNSAHDFDYGSSSGRAMHGPNASAGLAQNAMYSSARYLEEENAALRRRIDELKKQVADLMATNEFLLEQNAQLRAIGKAGQVQSQPAAPVVSMAPPLPPMSTSDLMGQQRQPDLAAVSTALVTNALVPAASLGIQPTAITSLPISSIASMSLPTSVSLSSSAPLVSYPIITTQSMRPTIMTHSLGH